MCGAVTWSNHPLASSLCPPLPYLDKRFWALSHPATGLGHAQDRIECLPVRKTDIAALYRKMGAMRSYWASVSCMARAPNDSGAGHSRILVICVNRT